MFLVAKVRKQNSLEGQILPHYGEFLLLVGNYCQYDK